MNDLQALRAAVLSISSANDFDSFVESTDTYLRLFEKKIYPIRNNSKKSTRLYGHLAVSVWTIMSQFEFFKKTTTILPEFLLIKLSDFMSLHLNLMVQSRVTDDGYVNRFKHFLLCVLKSNYEYVMLAFMKSSKTIAFCNSPVIPPLLKKINSHIINYDRDLSRKHPLEVAWRYMFLKVCLYKFAFRSKGTLALHEDIIKYMEEKYWSKSMFETIDLKWNELLDVFLLLSDRGALWIESRRLYDVLPYEKMMNQHLERKCTLVDIEVDVFFSMKSICQKDDTLKYREIDLEFNEEETSVQKCWNIHREAFGTDDHLLQSDDDNCNIDSITNPFPSCVISHIDSVLDYTLDNLHQFNGLVIDDNTNEQQNFSINCDILNKVLSQIADNFLPDESEISSMQFVPNSVDPEPRYPHCCQEFTIGSNQFQKWNSNLKTFQFMCELSGSDEILYKDRIVTINRMIEITDLDFCRTEDVPKASIAINYGDITAEQEQIDFNKSYNMFVLNEREKHNNALVNVPQPFITRDINKRINDTDFGANTFNKRNEFDYSLSTMNLQHQKPTIEYVQEPNELQYTHKKLGKRHRKTNQKSICSWVASNHNSGTLSLVLDVEIVTSNELIQSQNNRRKGGKRKRRKKIFRLIDGFWVNNDESKGDFSELLAVGSEKFQKQMKKYPNPGPLSTKNRESGSRSRPSLRKPTSLNSTKKTASQKKLIETNVQNDSDDTIVLNGNIYGCATDEEHINEDLNKDQNRLNSISTIVVTEESSTNQKDVSSKVVKTRKKRRRNRGLGLLRKKQKIPEEYDEVDEQQSPKLFEEEEGQLKKSDDELQDEEEQHQITRRKKNKQSTFIKKGMNGLNNKVIIDERDLSPTINGNHIISSSLSDDCEYDHLNDSKTLRIRLKSTSSDDEQTLSQLRMKTRKKRTMGLYVSDGSNIKLACGRTHIVTPRVQLTPQSKLVSVNGFTRKGMRTRSSDRNFKKVVANAEFFSDDDDL